MRPITAAGLVFRPPPGAGRRAWSAHDRGGLVELCSLAVGRGEPDDCVRRDAALTALGSRSFRIIIHDTRRMRWNRVTERPVVEEQPGSAPLVSAGIKGKYDWDDPEGYQIERIRAWSREPILTTSARWPLVSCDPHGGEVLCVMGFRIGSAFVETMWWTHRMPDQAELWRVGSGINRRLRGLLAVDSG